MRCQACNCVLSNLEATRRVASSGDFLDLCDHCYGPIRNDVPTIENAEVSDEGAIEDVDAEG